MTTPMEGSSDIKNRESHAHSGATWLKGKEKVETFYAKARTLTSILDDVEAPTIIALLSLDVEGGEFEVLSGIDFNKYKFSWILVEARDVERISELLIKNGYKLNSKLTSQDYLFQLV